MTPCHANPRESEPGSLWHTPAVFAAAGLLVVLLSPFRWITALSKGDVGLEPIHIALVCLVVASAISPPFANLAKTLLAGSRVFWLSYAAYLLSSLVFLLPYGLTESVINLLPQLLYLPGFFCLAVLILHFLLAGRTGPLHATAGIAPIATLLALVVSAQLAGVDIHQSLSRLLDGGTIATFNRTFTSAVFGYANSTLTSGDSTTYATSIANELVSCLVVLYALMKASRPRSNLTRHRLVEICSLGALLCVVATAFSRSGILECAFMFTVAIVLKAFSQPSSSGTGWLLSGAAISCALLAIVAWTPNGSLEAILLDPTSTESRLGQFRTALVAINEYPLAGTGGAIRDDAAHDIHNLFLGTWTKAGVVPVCFVLLAYLSVAASLVRSIANGLSLSQRFWVLACPFNWVMTLPLVVLFRVFFSGKGGTFSVSMWLSAAAFIAFIVANERARAIGATQR